MNIGVVCYPTYGGSGVVATELGIALANKGYRIHFISYRQPARLMQLHFHENILYHDVSLADYPLFEYAPYESALASTLVNVAKKEKLDLVHVHYAIPHAASAYLAKQILKQRGIKFPVITTLHGTDITLVGKNKYYTPVVAFSIEESDGVTTVSESLKKDTIEYFKIERHIEVIPNFIDFNRFIKTDKDHFKKAIAPNGEKIILHTSNFRKVKRVQDVVLMFQKVVEKIPVKLLLIGDGPERNKLEKLTRELGLSEHIRFLGKQQAVEELLAVGDLFVLPSESESFGLAALEAMACQLPVISTNTGGLPEINIQGKTGYLSEVGDIEAMGNHALDILSDDDRLQTFKQNAFEQAKSFDINLIMPKYEAYYEKVLKAYS